MKNLFLLFLTIIFTGSPLLAQKKDFTYNFYGFVRGDLFYNTRANVAPVDGNFYMYPLDKELDANGKDLNATPNGSFYTFTTRFGLDLSGPMLGTAQTSAKIETDFGGFSSSTTMLRIRQAYVALDWDKSQLLIGQTWHPMFGSVFPDMLNLSTGAPFQPFNRSPMFRLRHKVERVEFLAATIWQLQYQSMGPNGSSEDYIKNSCIPEIYIGADYAPKNGWLIGAGARLISLKPRTSATWNNNIYKVDERITTLSYEAHLKYTGKKVTIAAKSFLTSATENMSMLSGYGVSSVNSETGEQKYTPYQHSTSWLNITYGSKWKPGIFVGYTKNLGTKDALVSADKLYGRGLNMDQLYMVNPSFSYNLPHWRLGVEYCLSTAYYGTTDLENGKVKDTHSVTNHRILGLLVYLF